ncbi:MAG: hypothetical protein GYA17_03380, partial [Chloroflexi bacterium]|nr:hypothetical protein [Chloroflexota bacterium]
WYINRLFRNLRMASSPTWVTVNKPVGEAALKAPSIPAIQSEGGIPQIPMGQAQQTAPAASAEPRFKVQAPSAEDEQLQRAITRITEENPASVAEIIQLWLSEDNK